MIGKVEREGVRFARFDLNFGTGKKFSEHEGGYSSSLVAMG